MRRSEGTATHPLPPWLVGPFGAVGVAFESTMRTTAEFRLAGSRSLSARSGVGGPAFPSVACSLVLEESFASYRSHCEATSRASASKTRSGALNVESVCLESGS